MKKLLWNDFISIFYAKMQQMNHEDMINAKLEFATFTAE